MKTAAPSLSASSRQLSLFDESAVSSWSSPARPPASTTTTAFAPRGGEPAATPHQQPPASLVQQPVAGPSVPAPTPAPVGATTPWLNHPRATREIRLGEHRVAYEFKRASRRTIGFSVGVEGLTVSAPRWVSISDIEAGVREKGAWILRKLAEARERAQRQQAARVEWRDGTSIPFLGEPVIVVLDPRAGGAVGGAVLQTADQTLPDVPRLTLHVGLPQHADGAQIRDAVQSWLQRQARRIFEQRCAHFASTLGVRMKRLSLSSASTRWGSASADGAIRLNWRLVHFAMPTIDYVVVHELAHLRHMDHSPRFWDVVRSVVPDYLSLRGTLKDESLPKLD